MKHYPLFGERIMRRRRRRRRRIGGRRNMKGGKTAPSGECSPSARILHP
jgi:hypothetical protein